MTIHRSQLAQSRKSLDSLPRTLKVQPSGRKKRELFEKVLAVGLAIVGFLWQMVTVSSIYFKYFTTAEISIVKPPGLRPPAMTICFPWYQQLEDEEIDGHLSQISALNYTSLSQRQHHELEDRLTTTSRTIKQIDGALKYLDITITYRKPKSFATFKDVFNSETFNSRRFLKGSEICYSVSHANQSSAHYSLNYERLISGRDPGMILEASLKADQLKFVLAFSLYLHQAKRFPRSRGDFPLEGQIQANKVRVQRSVSYAKIEARLLPPPYATHCKDYLDSGFESAHHYYEECLSREATERFDGLLFTTTKADGESEQRMIGKHDIASNASLRREIRKVIALCDQLSAAPDCVQEQYLPQMSIQRPSRDFAIGLRVPNEPDIVTIFQVKMTLAEYLTYLLSCVGFWFGVSAVRFVSDLRRLTFKSKHD